MPKSYLVLSDLLNIMSGLTLGCLNCPENEFLAEEEMINITPEFDHAEFYFIRGKYGPFTSNFDVDVPLWLAITLRKQGKCRIAIPEWMSIENLEKKIADERKESSLQSLPFHYIEIAHLLLNNAREDIQSPDRVAVLIQDLENIRMDRIRLGVMNVAASVSKGDTVLSGRLVNVAAMEVFSIKRFFLNSMNSFYWLNPPENAAQENDNQDDQLGSGKKLRRFRNT